MTFYFDENFSHYIASAINELEKSDGRYEVKSTEIEFGKGIKDEDLIPLIGEAGGILITMDHKIKTKKHQYELLQQHGIGVFFIHANSLRFWDQVRMVIKAWENITKYARKTNKPFGYRLKRDGSLELLGD